MQMTAEKLVELAKQNPSGFTVDANGINVIGKYFVVGVKKTKNSHNIDGAKHCINVYNEMMDVETEWKELDIKIAFGGWLDKDTNTFHFDVVMLLEKDDDFNRKWSLKSALVLGMGNSQKSIFDLEHMLEVEVPRVTSYSVL